MIRISFWKSVAFLKQHAFSKMPVYYYQHSNQPVYEIKQFVALRWDADDHKHMIDGSNWPPKF